MEQYWVHPKFLQTFFWGNRPALVSKDGEQKDDKSQARSQREPVEKKGMRAAEWLAGEAEKVRSTEADQTRPELSLCVAGHATFGVVVAAPRDGVARFATSPPNAHYTRYCVRPAWGGRF